MKLSLDRKSAFRVWGLINRDSEKERELKKGGHLSGLNQSISLGPARRPK